MTPRERAEAIKEETSEPSLEALEAAENYWRDGNPTDVQISLALTLDAFATERIYALLADDEATIEMMALEFCYYPKGPSDLNSCCQAPMGDKTCQRKARAALAALRRKALKK